MWGCTEFHIAFHDPVIVSFLRLEVVEPKQAYKFSQTSSFAAVAGNITLFLPLREAHTAVMDQLVLASTASKFQKRLDDYQVVVARSSWIHLHGMSASFWHLTVIIQNFCRRERGKDALLLDMSCTKEGSECCIIEITASLLERPQIVFLHQKDSTFSFCFFCFLGIYHNWRNCPAVNSFCSRVGIALVCAVICLILQSGPLRAILILTLDPNISFSPQAAFATRFSTLSHSYF